MRLLMNMLLNRTVERTLLYLDGNFNHRHKLRAGDCPPIPMELEWIVPTSVVDSVRNRMDEVRKRSPRPYSGTVPQAALQDCESSHAAGNDHRAKTKSDRFDDKGFLRWSVITTYPFSRPISIPLVRVSITPWPCWKLLLHTYHPMQPFYCNTT